MKAIVLRAPGTNCDYETGFALQTAGFQVKDIHINELIKEKKLLKEARLLAIPGGFSSGDYLGSGKVFANKINYSLQNTIPDFINAGNLMIGICNGFQVMVKAGILPGFEKNYTKQLVSLTINNPLGFQCKWVKLKKQESKCVFTKELEEEIYLPIAHGEGKLVVKNREILQKMYEKKQVVFKYESNPNGSIDSIAGICDETGRVLGLMPHPERHLQEINSPKHGFAKEKEERGIEIFKNAFNYLKH